MDENAKTYLERELGLQQANQLMSSQLNIWYWDVRFFRPQQEEEFDVRVSPSGNIVGYEHKIEEARAGASLERAEAQAKAQNFLSGKLGVDLNEWDFLPEEANSEQAAEPPRLVFHLGKAWISRQRRAVPAAGRPCNGDEGRRQRGVSAGSGRVEARLPRLRSGNDTLAAAFTIPYILILAMAVWLAIRAHAIEGRRPGAERLSLGAIGRHSALSAKPEQLAAVERKLRHQHRVR